MRFFDIISNIGVQPHVPEGVQDKIRLANWMCFTILVTVFFFGVLHLCLGHFFLSLYSFACVPLYLSFFYLNKIGKHILSRNLINLVGIVVVSIFTLMIGRDGGLDFFYFTSIALTFSIFHHTERKYIVINILFIVLIWGLIESTGMHSLKSTEDRSIAPIYYSAMFFSSSLTIIYLLILLSSLKSSDLRLEKNIHQLEDKEKELRIHKEQLLNAQKLAKLGNFEFDYVHNTKSWSEQAAIIFGLPSNTPYDSELVFSLIHPEDKQLVLEKWELSYEQKKHFDIEYKILKPNGGLGFVKGLGEPIFNEKGDIIKFVGTLQDITQNKLYEIDLKMAKMKAESAAKSKSDFLSNMSHEIRTPMNAIIGFADLLSRKELEGQDLSNVHAIKDSADHLLVIINDILDFSKIEAGKIIIEQTPFDLDKSLFQLKSTFLYKAENKGLNYTVEVAKNVPRYLQGDPVRLHQILINIVGNSIKFTSKGHVKVEVSLLDNKDKEVQLLFKIMDSGIGIAQDKLSKIFESFSQAEVSVTRNFGGTGLGLTISKKLIELMKGMISVESKLGMGSCFQLLLPFKELENSTMKAQESPILNLEDVDLSTLKVLMAEDNAMNQMLAKQLFKTWGINYLKIAANGKIALEMEEQEDFDLILMDLQMPELDGYETTKAIKGNGRNKEKPIVALTADAFPEIKEKVMKIGMYDFLTKPINKKELYELLQKVARSRDNS